LDQPTGAQTILLTCASALRRELDTRMLPLPHFWPKNVDVPRSGVAPPPFHTYLTEEPPLDSPSRRPSRLSSAVSLTACTIVIPPDLFRLRRAASTCCKCWRDRPPLCNRPKLTSWRDTILRLSSSAPTALPRRPHDRHPHPRRSDGIVNAAPHFAWRPTSNLLSLQMTGHSTPPPSRRTPGRSAHAPLRHRLHGPPPRTTANGQSLPRRTGVTSYQRTTVTLLAPRTCPAGPS
jgi:hypothetical protein